MVVVADGGAGRYLIFADHGNPDTFYLGGETFGPAD